MVQSPLDIVVLVGSLRKESFSRKLALALAELAPDDLALRIVEIRQLPFYDQDLETETPPAEWAAFRAEIRRADGVLFVTPEYNRSVPAVLKNAIDVGSRPYGKSAWDGKPGAVASISTGQYGAFGANHHLRQSMVFVNVAMLQQPEVYLAKAASLFDGQGRLTNPETADFLRKFLDAFRVWVRRHGQE